MRSFAVGVLCVLVALALAWLVFPLLFRFRGSRIRLCLSHVKNLAIAMSMYAEDYNGHFPESTAWCDTLFEYVKDPDIFRCDKAPSLRCGYAYNAHMPDTTLDRLSDAARNTVVIFESDRGWNAAGTMDLLPKEPRHLGGDYYGFADGSARWVSRDEASSLIWEPAPRSEPMAPGP